MCKIDHSRRQFMKTASYAAMAGVTASPTHAQHARAGGDDLACSFRAHRLPRPGLRLPAGWQ